ALVAGLAATFTVTAGCASDTTQTEDAKATAAQALVTPNMVYTINVDQLHIGRTRAVHLDTDVASAAARGTTPGQGSASYEAGARDIGSLNNGYHAVNATLSGIRVQPTSTVDFSFVVANSGYDRSSNAAAESALNGISDVAKGVANVFAPSGVW